MGGAVAVGRTLLIGYFHCTVNDGNKMTEDSKPLGFSLGLEPVIHGVRFASSIFHNIT